MRSVVILVLFPLNLLMCCLPLAAFILFSLTVFFINLNILWIGVVFLVCIFLELLGVFWTNILTVFISFGKCSVIFPLLILPSILSFWDSNYTYIRLLVISSCITESVNFLGLLFFLFIFVSILLFQFG